MINSLAATNHDTIFIEVAGVMQYFEKKDNKMVHTWGNRITLTNDNMKSFDFSVVAKYNFDKIHGKQYRHKL